MSTKVPPGCKTLERLARAMAGIKLMRTCKGAHSSNSDSDSQRLRLSNAKSGRNFVG